MDPSHPLRRSVQALLALAREVEEARLRVRRPLSPVAAVLAGRVLGRDVRISIHAGPGAPSGPGEVVFAARSVGAPQLSVRRPDLRTRLRRRFLGERDPLSAVWGPDAPRVEPGDLRGLVALPRLAEDRELADALGQLLGGYGAPGLEVGDGAVRLREPLRRNRLLELGVHPVWGLLSTLVRVARACEGLEVHARRRGAPGALLLLARGGAPARCPYCHDALEARDQLVLRCPACRTPHHAACLHEAGRCTALGCAGRAPLPRSTGR